MLSWFDHGSGIIIIIACGSERPASTSNSSALSNIAESLPFGLMIGQDLLDVVAEQLGLEQRLARVHPVDVAAQRVDLAVVRDVAVRMRAVPARERVRAETRMHQRQRGLHRRVLQVGEILVDLLGEQHALVDERLAGQAGDVPVLGAGDRGGADLAVGALADDVELALERHVVRRAPGCGR